MLMMSGVLPWIISRTIPKKNPHFFTWAALSFYITACQCVVSLSDICHQNSTYSQTPNRRNVKKRLPQKSMDLQGCGVHCYVNVKGFVSQISPLVHKIQTQHFRTIQFLIISWTKYNPTLSALIRRSSFAGICVSLFNRESKLVIVSRTNLYGC